MNPETLLKDTMREWADEARVPHDLADRVLGRRLRRGNRTVFLAAAAAVVTAATLVTVPAVLRGHPAPDHRAAATATIDPLITPAPAEPAETDVRVDTGNSPPTRLIAAGRIAVSAYLVSELKKIQGRQTFTKTWYLYNPRTETYEPTDWRALDVSPGLRYAAALEGELPSRRLIVVDVATRRVLRRIELDEPVMQALWSPDGTRLLTTAYDVDPTVGVPSPKGSDTFPESNRLGFHVVEVNTGRVRFHDVRGNGQLSSRFVWAAGGTLVRERSPEPIYYDLDGHVRPAPAGTRLSDRSAEPAGLSPDGRLFADRALPAGPRTVVKDARTGKTVGVQNMENLLAWADDTHLIALACAGDCSARPGNERLVLVGLDGKQITRLSDVRAFGRRPSNWEPLLTRR